MRPTCKGGILREDIFWCWPKHDEDINYAAFRDPMHICLWSLARALNVIQHFSKHGLERDKREWVNHCWLKSPAQRKNKKRTYLPSCVGADIHPGLSSIEPEDARGSLGVVGQHDRDSAIKGHRVVQLVLEHIQVIETIWISIPETEKYTQARSNAEKTTPISVRVPINIKGISNSILILHMTCCCHSLCCFEPEGVCVFWDAVDVLNTRQWKV